MPETKVFLRDEYSSDLTLVEIAKGQTPCFGIHFEIMDKTCQTCPLGRSCQESFHENLSIAEVRLQEAKKTSSNNDLGRSHDYDGGKIRYFSPYVECVCCVCGKNINQGIEACHHIRHGFFHLECEDSFRQGQRVSS